MFLHTPTGTRKTHWLAVEAAIFTLIARNSCPEKNRVWQGYSLLSRPEPRAPMGLFCLYIFNVCFLFVKPLTLMYMHCLQK